MKKVSQPYILVVDDDLQVLTAINRDLRKRYGGEYSILRAESGQEALSILEDLKIKDRSLALILSDQRMPQMDGVTMLTESRGMYEECKRVLLTAYMDTEAAIGAINKSQVDYYLLKPWDPPEEQLYPVLDDLLEDWKSENKPGYGGLKVIGNRWSTHTHELKDFLARNHVPYQFWDVERSKDAIDWLRQRNIQELPVVSLVDGVNLIRPTIHDLASQIGFTTQSKEPFYDVIVVGAGPAGLASALYAASEGLKTVLVEREAPGGQAGTSSRIENYLGFPSGLSGSDLARRAITQIKKFGVSIISPQNVVGMRLDGPYKYVQLSNGSEIASHIVMLAMGVQWRHLNADCIDDYVGRGVYYGAAMSESKSCEGEDVYIVGAANSAGQTALYFSEIARKVIMIVRGASIQEKMSSYLCERILQIDNIEIMPFTEIARCFGQEFLEGFTLKNTQSGHEQEIRSNTLFVMIGAEPNTQWLEGIVFRDQQGYILTGPELNKDIHLKDWPLARNPYLFETNIPGVFAAGDIRFKSVKRVASAVGEGSVAVFFMHEYLNSL